MRALVAVALAAAGCYSPNAAVGVPCSTSFECPGSQVCDRHRSPPTCVASLPLDAPGSAVDAPSVDAPVADARASLFVRDVTATSSAATSLVLTFPSPPAVGDTLVLVGGMVQSSFSAVSGGGATNWSRATLSNLNCDIEIWIGTVTGSDATVTVTFGASLGDAEADVSEWSGLVGTSEKDNARAGGGHSSTASPGNLFDNHAHDVLLFGAVAVAPNAFDAPMPPTWQPLKAASTGNCAEGLWWKEVTSTGTQLASVSASAAKWDAAIVSLKIAP